MKNEPIQNECPKCHLLGDVWRKRYCGPNQWQHNKLCAKEQKEHLHYSCRGCEYEFIGPVREDGPVQGE